VGAIIALGTYLHGRARRELTWHAEHNLLIENSKTNIDGLEVKFKGRDITSLKSTMLTIKNTGNRHLTNEHIAQGGILFSIGASADSLLSVDLLEEDAEKPNEYRIAETADNSAYALRFSDMAKKELLRVQILHTAEDNPKINFSKGTLRDGKINSQQERDKKLETFLFKIALTLICCSAPIVLLGFGFMAAEDFFKIVLPGHILSFRQWALGIGGIGIFVGFSIFLWLDRNTPIYLFRKKT